MVLYTIKISLVNFCVAIKTQPKTPMAHSEYGGGSMEIEWDRKHERKIVESNPCNECQFSDQWFVCCSHSNFKLMQPRLLLSLTLPPSLFFFHSYDSLYIHCLAIEHALFAACHSIGSRCSSKNGKEQKYLSVSAVCFVVNAKQFSLTVIYSLLLHCMQCDWMWTLDLG